MDGPAIFPVREIFPPGHIKGNHRSMRGSG